MDGYSILFHQSYGNFIGPVDPHPGTKTTIEPKEFQQAAGATRDSGPVAEALKDLRADANLLPAENLGVL